MEQRGTNHRKQMAFLTRAWRQELRDAGYSAKQIKDNVMDSVAVMDGIMELGLKYNADVEVISGTKP